MNSWSEKVTCVLVCQMINIISIIYSVLLFASMSAAMLKPCSEGRNYGVTVGCILWRYCGHRRSFRYSHLSSRKSTVDGSPTVMANFNLSMYPFWCWISGSFNLWSTRPSLREPRATTLLIFIWISLSLCCCWMVPLTSEINRCTNPLALRWTSLQTTLSSSCVLLVGSFGWRSCYRHFITFNTHFMSSSSSCPSATSNLSTPFACHRKWHLCKF